MAELTQQQVIDYLMGENGTFSERKSARIAAKLIEQQQAEIDRLSRLHDEWCQVFDPLAEYVRANSLAKIGERKVDALVDSHRLQQAEIAALKAHLDNFSIAANGLIEFVINKYGLGDAHELQCPHMIALATALAKADGEKK